MPLSRRNFDCSESWSIVRSCQGSIKKRQIQHHIMAVFCLPSDVQKIILAFLPAHNVSVRQLEHHLICQRRGTPSLLLDAAWTREPWTQKVKTSATCVLCSNTLGQSPVICSITMGPIFVWVCSKCVLPRLYIKTKDLYRRIDRGEFAGDLYAILPAPLNPRIVRVASFRSDRLTYSASISMARVFLYSSHS